MSPTRAPAIVAMFAVAALACAASSCSDTGRTLWIAPNAGETAIHLVDIEPNPF